MLPVRSAAPAGGPRRRGRRIHPWRSGRGVGGGRRQRAGGHRVARDAGRRRGRVAPVFVMRGNRDFLLGERFAAENRRHAAGGPPAWWMLTAKPVSARPRRRLLHARRGLTSAFAPNSARRLGRPTCWPSRWTSAGRWRPGCAPKAWPPVPNKAAGIMDVTPAAVEAALVDADAPLLVHGHTHRPGIHRMAGGRRRIVLGDWQTVRLAIGPAAKATRRSPASRFERTFGL